jgi:4-amino-4-deoxy-L-arabinose transferase-like glycosyltransferase
LPIVGLGLGLRLSLFFIVLPTPDRFLYAPDSFEYNTLAENWLSGHGFSTALSPPFVPDLSRTPVYPLLLAVIAQGTNHDLRAAIMVNIALSMITIALTFQLALRLFDLSAAVPAALLIAIDIASIAYSNMLLTEALFTALLIAAVLALADYRLSMRSGHALISGLFFGLSALCRPIGTYLTAVALPVFVGHPRTTRMRRLFHYLLLNLGFGSLLGLWLLRNYLTFGGSDLSSVGAVNLYFHRAAAIQAILEHSDVVTVRDRWEHEFSTLSLGWSEEQKVDWLNRHALKVIREHPAIYMLVYGEGLLRMFGPERDILPQLLGWERAPTAASLIGGIGWLQLFIVYALAAVGAIYAWRSPRERHALILLLAFVCYFIATAGPEAYARFRVPVMPLIAVLAGNGLKLNWRTRGQASAKI